MVKLSQCRCSCSVREFEQRIGYKKNIHTFTYSVCHLKTNGA